MSVLDRFDVEQAAKDAGFTTKIEFDKDSGITSTKFYKVIHRQSTHQTLAERICGRAGGIMPIVHSKAMAETILGTIKEANLFIGLMGFLKAADTGPYFFIWPNGQLKTDWTTCSEMSSRNVLNTIDQCFYA